jgi:hypothetical protein
MTINPVNAEFRAELNAVGETTAGGMGPESR